MNTNLKTPWQHWKLDTDADGITWLTLDKAGENVNSLSKAVMAELASVLDYLDANRPRSLVIRSGKTAGFVAGADAVAGLGAAYARALRPQPRRACGRRAGSGPPGAIPAAPAGSAIRRPIRSRPGTRGSCPACGRKWAR